jgi:hypothetical protein
LNSSKLSHDLDTGKGLENFVRLSFCKKHPMMYTALKDNRISRPVVLEIKVQAVCRPGVRFCERNAAAKDAVTSEDLRVIHFDIVKGTYLKLSTKEKAFFQGEVLVPGCIPPHLIKVPNVDIWNQPLETSQKVELCGQVLNSALVGCSLKGKTETMVATSTSSTTNSSSTTESTFTAAGGGIAPSVLSFGEHSAGVGLSNQETLAPNSSVSSMSNCGDGSISLEEKGLSLATESKQHSTEIDKSSHAEPLCRAIAGVVAIKADGDCCYHAAGVISSLCKDANAVKAGRTVCSREELSQARALILENFAALAKSKQEFFPLSEELEAHTAALIGEASDVFIKRVSGGASGKDRHGANIDLALAMWREDVRVVIVDTNRICLDTPDTDLHKATEEAIVAGERDKSRVVCLVLHKNHFDLCVLQTPGSVQAVFQMGQEWQRALELILGFVRSKAPSVGQERRPLGPQWRVEESEKSVLECESVGIARALA